MEHWLRAEAEVLGPTAVQIEETKGRNQAGPQTGLRSDQYGGA